MIVSLSAINDYILMLKRALDKRDAEIVRLQAALTSCQARNEELIKELQNKINKGIQEKLDKTEKMWGPSIPAIERLRQRLQEDTLQRYRGALKDLEGSLEARAAHDKELAEKIHNLL